MGLSDTFIKIEGKYYKNQQVYEIWHEECENRKRTINVIACDFLDYNTGQVFPTVLTKKLKELEFYGYDVIMETIEKCRSSIEYSIKTKSFKNDMNKISYIMAIIKNNINDVYKEHLRTEKVMEKQQEQATNFEAVNEDTIMNIGSKQKAKDISDFLEGDELWN